MPKFLTTAHISAELVNLIRTAKDEIVIISPYMKVNELLKSEIDLANARKVRFTIIYGKTDMRPEERAWIDGLTTRETGFISNLHAKCYLSESAAIVTSMNLYEYSQQNNDEMGILATREADAELYQDIYEEARRLGLKANLKLGTQVTPARTATPQPSPQPQRNEVSADARTAPCKFRSRNRLIRSLLEGYCIRCQISIEFNRERPLCGDCFGKWARFRNREFPEKFCHKWGGPASTTFAKPLCGDCFSDSIADDSPF